MMLLKSLREGALAWLAFLLVLEIDDMSMVITYAAGAVGLFYTVSALYSLEAVFGLRSHRSVR